MSLYHQHNKRTQGIVLLPEATLDHITVWCFRIKLKPKVARNVTFSGCFGNIIASSHSDSAVCFHESKQNREVGEGSGTY